MLIVYGPVCISTRNNIWPCFKYVAQPFEFATGQPVFSFRHAKTCLGTVQNLPSTQAGFWGFYLCPLFSWKKVLTPFYFDEKSRRRPFFQWKKSPPLFSVKKGHRSLFFGEKKLTPPFYWVINVTAPCFHRGIIWWYSNYFSKSRFFRRRRRRAAGVAGNAGDFFKICPPTF